MSPMPYPHSLADAEAFDAQDELAALRSYFVLPDGVTYLVGHSLGPATRSAVDAVQSGATQDWAMGLVGSWNNADWIELPSMVGARIARLIGVGPDDVIVCDSVSLNLFKLVGAILSQNRFAKRIIVEAAEFPTDQYILERLAKLTGAQFIRAEPGKGRDHLAQGGVLVRSLVDYRTGAIEDVEATEALAQAGGGAVVWDLSHATGVLDLTLAQHGVQYAVGCTYKYLNGGPGAPAFLYAAPDKTVDLETPLAGWLGHANPFAFTSDYQAAPGVQRFVAGTPPILSMLALNGALDLFDGVSMAAIETKARALGDMCLMVFERLGLSSISPPIGQARGGHVSLTHSDGYALSRALADRGIKADFRTPSTIRFGLSPLYLGYAEVWRALEALADVLTRETYRDEKYRVRDKVT